jgi:predicted pyridoxine 5'-phosphate oxidase superfamily flavin-nucleotide-binding protein
MSGQTMTAPFHAGELRAQQLAGGGPPGFAIRNFMPDQHRSFFPLLPFLCVGVTDRDGWPLATILTGAPGFVSSPTPHTLAIAATTEPGDPARGLLLEGAAIGLLGIELPTRRRNRANGVLASSGNASLLLEVQQSFGNCPKYIRTRTLLPVHEPAPPLPPVASDGLSAQAAALIARCDTLFVASASGGTVDISHRGGHAGFVQVQGDTLVVPDYPGNRYFNTLGNLLLEPRCALVLVDFNSGDILQLQGKAEILWDKVPAGDRLAQRSWTVQVKQCWLRRSAFPLRSSEPD